jgi:hypothetical protein
MPIPVLNVDDVAREMTRGILQAPAFDVIGT